MSKRFNRHKMFCCWLLVGGLLFAVGAQQAHARPYFLKMWIEAYPDVAKDNDVKEKVKCNVCHVGTNKKMRNAYGKALQKAFGKKLKKSDDQEFNDGLKKVEGEKSETEGKTFGDLLKDKKLPSTSK
jgi:hypothetical protein